MPPADCVQMPMTMFPLLADTTGYVPHLLDLDADTEARHYWIAVFEDHLTSLVRHCHANYGDTPEVQADVEQFRASWASLLNRVREQPGDFQPLSILSIAKMRERALIASGMADPYAYVKRDENEQAMALLPALLGELDAMGDADRLLAMITGVFAGNIFDLGARATNAMFDAGQVQFHAVLDKITPRPWLVDDFDALAARWSAGAHRKAVVFVDNAGPDLVLGMIPLVREMLKRGTTVVLTSNTLPSLNDITHTELVPLIDRVGEFDDVIREALITAQLKLIPSGNGAPLIDLNEVSIELAEAAADADLVVLEGMGRAIESNFHARFSCDALKLAIIKDEHLADHFGGKLYDVVCRFDSA